MIVRKAMPQDLEGLIPLFKEFLCELGQEMSDEDILTSLMLCSSNRGLLMIALIDDIPIAVGGGIYKDKGFIGEIAYVKPKFRHKTYRAISSFIKEIKKTAEYWDVICDPVRFKMWNKLGFMPYKVWLRRAI